MTWTVQMYPEEKAFIDEVFRRTLNNEDGRGDFIAPLRGGIIYLKDYEEFTEEQTKWLVFCQLQHARYKHAGVAGLKFQNFSYNEPLPPIFEDPEAMDKWGVLRMTTEGQPIEVHGSIYAKAGLPITKITHEVKEQKLYHWNAEQQRYIERPSIVMENYRFAESGRELPEKVLD